MSSKHKGLNEKKPILAMILLLFSLMLLAIPMIPHRKARCYRTPNNQPNSSLIETEYLCVRITYGQGASNAIEFLSLMDFAVFSSGEDNLYK